MINNNSWIIRKYALVVTVPTIRYKVFSQLYQALDEQAKLKVPSQIYKLNDTTGEWERIDGWQQHLDDGEDKK